ADDTAPKRLSGVMSLRTFLGDEQRRVGAGQSLASALAFEKDRVVRNAIADALARNDLDVSVARAALEVLITNSRGLVEDGNLREVALTNDDRRAEPSSALSRAATVGDVINKLSTRKNIGITDYTGIYCARCNYQKAPLRGAHFDNAVLVNADF